MPKLNSFVAGFLACALCVFCMGAFQPGNQRYLDACLAVQGESSMSTVFAKDPNRAAAYQKRLDYWVKVMEQFKP